MCSESASAAGANTSTPNNTKRKLEDDAADMTGDNTNCEPQTTDDNTNKPKMSGDRSVARVCGAHPGFVACLTHPWLG